MASRGTFKKLRPLSLLTHLASCSDSGLLRVYSKAVAWSIYLEQGKIIYASHSVEPFDRLDCNLRRLSSQNPTITADTRVQLRLRFENAQDTQAANSDYKALCWLVDQQYLNSSQIKVLIQGLVKEVLESFLLLQEGTYELSKNIQPMTTFCQLDLQPMIESCQKNLQGWKALAPQVWSPYQRPVLSNQTQKRQQLSPEIEQKLRSILKGFSFRHLAILLNQNEIQLAQSLQPYIISETILLHEPSPPFDQLPKTFEQLDKDSEPETSSNDILTKDINNQIKSHSFSKPTSIDGKVTKPEVLDSSSNQNGELVKYPAHQGGLPPINISPWKADSSLRKITDLSPQKVYKIVCVDDSPTVLREISYFLDDESFSVFTINDPIKALMQIVRIKPDLVLLDVRMAGIDGYELCRLLRNHSLFKHIPIIMVTGNTGIIDRVKARVVGASGYLTKPFTQSELLKMVFRHLS